MSITKKDFLNVSEDSFNEIKNYIHTLERLIIDPMDYHFEETERGLFNWMHKDSGETPMEIKSSPLPRCMINVLHVKEGWFYWHIKNNR